MGYLRAAVALLVVGLACVAPASSALAREGGTTHHFVGNQTSEVEVLNSEQELSFAQLQIQCKGVKSARTHTKTVFPALKILVELEFVKCKTTPLKAGSQTLAPSKATFSGPLDIEYTANGEPDATIVNASTEAPVTIAFKGALAECKVSLVAKGVTDEALYTNTEVKAKSTKIFPTGVQHVVSIANTFEKLGYAITGGPCEALKKTAGNDGEYFGALLTGTKTGNLSWE
jgi:hypothetical protein